MTTPPPDTTTQTPAVPGRPKLGVCFVPTMAPTQLVPLARAVEEAELDDLWVWEDCFKESGVASAGIALASTERITVGIGLLPTPLRNVALTAMEFATLEGAFPGRLIAGIGHGVQDWMAQVGARAASPLTLLEEYATALRALLGGETVTTSGRYVTLDGVALDWPPSPPPPLMIGGQGPRAMAQAGRLGDGLLLAADLSYDQVREACDIAHREGGADRPVVSSLIVATGAGAEQRAEDEVRRWFNEPAPGRSAAGDADTVATTVRTLHGFGVTRVVFQPTQDEPDLPGLVRFLGQEVAPLLG
ncbi:alkanesulfonate monooxygenase SsuD/methylene tetrahydromethanopterin reductase-like flavin-dependent oxidoreductase (luciferase family) [Friedmanniella endophytica]|uniref:Alkanesulfonate monooxygenase SsuD/methylene tetrahydromethanopterin reductase-like flavin-dependent oxidoreductase (Luciferase family) n=1 Tax=Microlunatus kandeliicorticis TaxID=1759536 RepID=A0A7W3IQJ2_9ACTN|nr:LLM class flavin-dependent oxidoreductase [Microlunatus kandeliicorticis]MBA8793414.1 alkanesulfonate monooxygenase SsuD/methylene tetrahydromethanopterin reductase-like flavin-dependent oxidoreductase (luciferase family) [Microlunatus kandeliicorticis]